MECLLRIHAVRAKRGIPPFLGTFLFFSVPKTDAVSLDGFASNN